MSEKPDINAIGVLYVKSYLQKQQMEERKFDPATIEPWELRDGNMRALADPFNLYYQQDQIRRMNEYRGMFD